MPEPLLSVSNVETSYGLSQVLFGISLAIAPGEMVTLMGRNGMGKTTTIRSIMGLTPARAGGIVNASPSHFPFLSVYRTTVPSPYSSMRTWRAGCVRTILPFSWPRYFMQSAAFAITGRTTSAVTVPLMPGVHDFGTPMIGITRGAVIVA